MPPLCCQWLGRYFLILCHPCLHSGGTPEFSFGELPLLLLSPWCRGLPKSTSSLPSTPRHEEQTQLCHLGYLCCEAEFWVARHKNGNLLRTDTSCGQHLELITATQCPAVIWVPSFVLLCPKWPTFGSYKPFNPSNIFPPFFCLIYLESNW